jgi:hypothetical protein
MQWHLQDYRPSHTLSLEGVTSTAAASTPNASALPAPRALMPVKHRVREQVRDTLLPVTSYNADLS